jgi:hypothetical protein
MWQRLQHVLRKLKLVFVILGSATSSAAIVLAAIFHGFLIPHVPFFRSGVAGAEWVTPFVYLAIFGISVLEALVIRDLGPAIAAFFASYILAAAITFLVLTLPGYTGALPSPDLIVAAGVQFTFTAFFPLLFVELVATILGTALSEHLT